MDKQLEVNKQKKVFFLIMQLRQTGACKMLVWVANQMQRLGYDVVVCSYVKCDDNLYKELDDRIKYIDASNDKKPLLSKMISFFSGKERNYFDKWNIFANIKNIRYIIRQESPDISISFLLDSNVLNTIVCLGLSTKSIICERSNPFKSGYLKLKIFKPLFRLADGAVYQLESVSKFYNNIKRYAVIENPVQIKRDKTILSFNERNNEIIVVGRLSIEQKRQDLALQAFRRTLQKYPDMKLSFYGDGPDKEVIKTMAEGLGIAKNVRFMGVQYKIIEVMRQAKMLLLTSDYEGIPNVIIEAMSVGLPVVATDTEPGGAKALIDNGVNGIIVERGNSIAISEGINRVLQDFVFADNLGNNAYLINNTLSPDRIANKWSEFINEILYR